MQVFEVTTWRILGCKNNHDFLTLSYIGGFNRGFKQKLELEFKTRSHPGPTWILSESNLGLIGLQLVSNWGRLALRVQTMARMGEGDLKQGEVGLKCWKKESPNWCQI